MAAAASSPELAIPEHRLICRVCEKQYSKYTCPRCNSRYCSLPCYKNHSLRCTESFMRENVVEEMRDIQSTKESQKSMLETLMRIHFDEAGRSILDDENFGDEHGEGDSEDNHGKILSDKTLDHIAEGGEISLDRLSVDEKKSFLQAVAVGKISHLIQPWNPWWLNPLAGSVSITKQGTGLVRLVNQSQEQVKSGSGREESTPTVSEVPAPPSDPLPQIRELFHGPPSPLVSIQLAELIYSYCFTLRFCNGDWQSEPLDSAMILLSVSQVLDRAASPECIGVAIGETMKIVCSPAFKHAGGFRFAVSLLDDAVAVLCLGRACNVCALADIKRMLELSKMKLKVELGSEKIRRTKPAIKAVPGYLNGINKSCTEKLYPRTRRGVNKNSGNGGVPNESTGSWLIKTKSSELKKLTLAIRKVYFLMCWTNEQPNEEFLSLASLISIEKDRVVDIGMAKNSRLRIVQDTKSIVTRAT